MDCSLPGSSAHGIFQTRILEQAAISISRDVPTQESNLCLSCHLHWQAGSLPIVPLEKSEDYMPSVHMSLLYTYESIKNTYLLVGRQDSAGPVTVCTHDRAEVLLRPYRECLRGFAGTLCALLPLLPPPIPSERPGAATLL